MDYSKPIVLSIAGFDPSGGAGILADIKTFEQNGCLGFGLLSALTIQTEDRFLNVDWLDFAHIINQAEPLFEQYKILAVKIGIAQNMDVLEELISWLIKKAPKISIIWDPILSASTGFALTEITGQNQLKNIVQKLTLITPNIDEAKKLSGLGDEKQAAEMLAGFTNVLLKGGHSVDEKGTDYLYTGKNTFKIEGTKDAVFAKHGSGCILSSAITANLARGFQLREACIKAKTYTENRLKSNPRLLAYHAE